MPTLDWIGKQAVVNHHREVAYHLLRHESALSHGNAESGHLVVEGDNLLALKALLPFYAGQVKCIYIDPPYNTGNENWVYNDAVNSNEIRQWLGRVVGSEAEDLSRHDKWLCMMYPRLELLKQFLAPGGVIFISIDDVELAHLLAVCDEVFNPRHRIAVFSWVRKKKGSNLSKEFRKITEYVVAYKNTTASVELYGVPAYAEKEVPLLNRPNPVSFLAFPGKTIRVGKGVSDGQISAGDFGDGELKVELLNDVEISEGAIVTPFQLKGRFRWSQSTVDGEIQNGSVFTVSKTFRINVSRYNQADKFKALSSLLSPDDGIGTNEDATEELRKIFPELPKLPFDFPKPTSLVETLVRAVCKDDPEAIVLDSFAGSGTTGHAVLNVNRSDGGRRRFILVEMDQAICRNVTSLRLRRVLSEAADSAGEGNGFLYCSLDPPLFNEQGNIRSGVTFSDLAAHIYFAETGVPIKKQRGHSPLLGVHNGRAVCLLFNGILGDKKPDGGNVLTGSVLRTLPRHVGPRIVYGEGCRLSAARLKREAVVFKQVPYGIKVT